MCPFAGHHHVGLLIYQSLSEAEQPLMKSSESIEAALDSSRKCSTTPRITCVVPEPIEITAIRLICLRCLGQQGDGLSDFERMWLRNCTRFGNKQDLLR